MFAIFTAAFLLYACTPPGFSRNGGPSSYTTTVSGKITSPANNGIATAKVYVSIGSGKKFEAPTNSKGSYNLEVKGHSGSFTLTAEDPNGNYKTSAPQKVSTTGPSHTENIKLQYGRTTTLDGTVTVYPRGTNFGGSITNGVTIIIKVEGVKAAEGKTRQILPTLPGTTGNGRYSLNFAHNGSATIEASYTNMQTHIYNFSRLKNPTRSYSINLCRPGLPC